MNKTAEESLNNLARMVENQHIFSSYGSCRKKKRENQHINLYRPLYYTNHNVIKNFYGIVLQRPKY